MALKKQIDKAQYDALSEDFRKEYKAQGDKFVLDIEGDDGVDWKHKRDLEVEHRKKAEEKAKGLQDEVDNLRRGAIPKNDVEALENSWKTKVDEATKKGIDRETELLGVIANSTITNVANDVAQMFTVPGAMMPMVRGRLKSEIVDGQAVTRVLDKNGQLSALTIDDLKNEFKADATLAPVLVGSKASGGGANGGNGGQGAGGKKLSEMGDKERTELYRRDPAEFKRLVAEQNSTK